MFRRQSAGIAEGTSWPLSEGNSLVAGFTRTTTRFYNGNNPPALLSSTPGTGTTGTSALPYMLDPLGRFYVELVDTVTAVIGWRNAGTWTHQPITIPVYSNATLTTPACSLDGTRLYFRTDAGISEWRLNVATRTATKVVDATFGAPATGFTGAYGIQWIAADTLLIGSLRTDYTAGVRLIRKVSGTWVSLDTFVESTAFVTPSTCLYAMGALFYRQVSSTTSELRLVENNLTGPILIPSTIGLPVYTRVARDRTYAYAWYVDGDNLNVARVPIAGGAVQQFSIATGISFPTLAAVHPLDGGLVVINADTSVRMFRCGPASITAYTAGTVAVALGYTGRILGEPIA